MGQLRAEHHLQVVDPPGAQLLPHDPGQRAAAGLGDIRDPQQLGLQLVAGAQGRQDGNSPQAGLLDQVQLAADQVDAVHDIVEFPGEKFLPMGGVIGGADRVYHRVRVDVPHARRRDLRLILSHGGGQRAQLAVDVGYGYRVLVHQCQRANAAACQALSGVAAHTAQTKHRHMAAAELVQSGCAQYHFCSEKTLVHRLEEGAVISPRASCRLPAPPRRCPADRPARPRCRCCAERSRPVPASRAHRRPQSTSHDSPCS